MPTILITGCSSGIGLAAATALKERGYRVFATARKSTDVDKLNALGLEGIKLDVTDPTSRQQAIHTLLAKTNGTLDALFNNAGILYAGAIEDLSDEMIREQFETNVYGPIALTRLILPIMRKQGHGRIIQNSSILGVMTLPFYGAYNASKFALEGFTRTLHQELYGTCIQVSLINPGPITSQLRQNAFSIYEKNIQKNISLHQTTYEKLERSYFQPSERDKKVMQSPEAVIKQLIRALESKQPKLHYFVGMPSHLIAIANRILPEPALHWLLRKIT